MPTPFDAVSTYISAKDGNRPFLMRRAFDADAELEMVAKTDAISFPARAKGAAEIGEILVRRFARDFENVYTFCLTRPSAANRRHFPCHWLVGMSAKEDGAIRVGCGRYDWYFTPDPRCLAERLVITIDVMQVLPQDELDAIMGWLAALPYPWCTSEEAGAPLPGVDGLAPVGHYLSAARPIALEG